MDDDLTLEEMAEMAAAAFDDDDDDDDDVVLVLGEQHPSWCKCQRVCGGDQ